MSYCPVVGNQWSEVSDQKRALVACSLLIADTDH